MIRVLIVEDEMLVRLGLKNSVDWGKFGMTVIADAADGQAAEEIYLRERPDLVITDLRMPVMDGMELIARIRARDRETRIIILSCMDDFALARKAMSLGVSDYILKLTMSEEEIETVLKRAQEDLAGREGAGKAVLSSLNEYDSKEKFIKEFIYYSNRAENDFARYVQEAGLRLSPGRLAVCIMQVDHLDALLVKFNDRQGQRNKSALLAILDDITGRYGRGEAIYDNGSCYALIFSFSDIAGESESHKELVGILNNVMSVVNTHLNVYVSFGISGFGAGYGSLGRMYGEAYAALEQKFFSGSGMFFAGASGDGWAQACEKISALRCHPKLVNHIGDATMAEYDARINAFTGSGAKDGQKVLAFFSHLVQWLATLLYLEEGESVDLSLEAYEKIKKCETLDEAIEAFQGFLGRAVGEMLKKRNLGREVSAALQYMKANFNHDISLTQAADHVGLSPNYLGNLFKKELKVGFTEYLNDMRMDKAKELLLGTYLKSYEVSEKVGFSENTYFCKVFKKATGYSPNEYRKRLMKEWTEEMDNDQGKAN